MSSAIGASLRFNKPSELTIAHVIADKIFHAVAQVSMESASVLEYLILLLEEGAQGELDCDEPQTAELLNDIALHIRIIHEDLLKEEGK